MQADDNNARITTLVIYCAPDGEKYVMMCKFITGVIMAPAAKFRSPHTEENIINRIMHVMRISIGIHPESTNDFDIIEFSPSNALILYQCKNIPKFYDIAPSCRNQIEIKYIPRNIGAIVVTKAPLNSAFDALYQKTINILPHININVERTGYAFYPVRNLPPNDMTGVFLNEIYDIYTLEKIRFYIPVYINIYVNKPRDYGTYILRQSPRGDILL